MLNGNFVTNATNRKWKELETNELKPSIQEAGDEE